ncbi:type 1 fimbrial protein [Achromobacter spanius]|uniref:fimbrial protein n=1 Tax=Achromobacter TaxID=222 RepID=UPI000F8F856D|nr:MULTISPECIES: fimbrial protein [Achromobacter]AZS80757.1 type 1 fimbrial protein [Achromobacter spanius]MCD0500472.1 type 1 fimbrial protein [Achromobacter sp. MY14]MCW3151842.1 type 1 fimbrial protein [Achromobacter spanius]
MKRSILTALAASGLLVAVVAPGASFAAGGTVSFFGSISDVTCDVEGSVGGAAGNVDVPSFGTVKPEDVVNGSAPERNFQINVQGSADCADETKVRLQFDAHQPNIDKVTGNLKLVGAGSAAGVQIQIRNNRTEAPANTDPIRLGIADANPQVAEVKNDRAVLYYSAKYVPEDPTATSVGFGDGNSFVTYTLRYN